MIKARIFSLVLLAPVGQYVITLEEANGIRLLPIWIGIPEGNAIALKLQNEKTPRPMTHDLMADIIARLGARIERVVITDLQKDSYFARIDVAVNGKGFGLDARPSDSIALAIRTGAPLFIEEKVFQKCPRINKPITDAEVKKFKEDIQTLKPEDFFRKGGGV